MLCTSAVAQLFAFGFFPLKNQLIKKQKQCGVFAVGQKP